MRTIPSAGSDVDNQQSRQLIRLLVCLAVSVLVVQLGRVGTKVISNWLAVSDVTRQTLFLLVLATVVILNLFVIFRSRDRLLRTLYSIMVVLLLTTHLVTVTRVVTSIPSLVLNIIDGTALILLAGVFVRIAMLLVHSYQERHEQLLQNLAYGTSHRVGEDFLTGLVESIATTLQVDFVFVTEIDEETGSESIISSAGAEDHEVTGRAPSSGATHVSTDSPDPDTEPADLFRMELTDPAGRTIGHLALFHRPSSISPGQLSALQIFASRASAELQRLQADRKSRDLEARMLQGQKMESLGVLAGGIAHDFNNLLQAIRGYSELATATCAEDSPTQQALSQVDGVVDKGAMMCDRLLAYAGKSVRRNAVCRVNQLVKETVGIVESARADSRFRLELSEESLRVWGDPAQLSQVLMNLLTNAADAVDPANGEIIVRTAIRRVGSHPADQPNLRRDCDHVVIDVSDNGCGISDEVGNRIFDPFFTSKGDGRGIGLASVAGIVKDHSGDIIFRSQPTAGTTFTVTLPVTEEVEPPAVITPATPKQLEELSILLVDDDEMVRTSTGMMLQTAGITVTSTDSGLNALEIIAHQGDIFDTILIDQTMPGISGLETCRRLRERGVSRPVILMSGYCEVELDEGEEQVLFLGKPCSRKDLLAAVAKAAESDSSGSRRQERVAG